MARIEVNGLEIDYELIGPEGGQPLVLTPGGRYPRDSAGVPELGQVFAVQRLCPRRTKLLCRELPVRHQHVQHSGCVFDAGHVRKVEVLADLANGLGCAVAVLAHLVELGHKAHGFFGQLKRFDARLLQRGCLPLKRNLVLLCGLCGKARARLSPVWQSNASKATGPPRSRLSST